MQGLRIQLYSMRYFQKFFMDKGGTMAAVAVLAILVIWGIGGNKKRK